MRSGRRSSKRCKTSESFDFALPLNKVEMFDETNIVNNSRNPNGNYIILVNLYFLKKS